MLITPWLFMIRVAPPCPEIPPWTPHPFSDIGSEGNDEDLAITAIAALAERSSPSAPSGLSPLCRAFPFGETWGLLRAGMLRGSRGLRVCGRSWVSGLSLDTCFTYMGMAMVGLHRRFGYQWLGTGRNSWVR